MEFEASSYRSGFIGLIAAAGLAIVAIGLGRMLFFSGKLSLQQPPSPLVLGLSLVLLLILALLSLLVYWSVAALRLHYHLTRNGLLIYWGASRLVVPMERIQAVIVGRELDDGEEGASKWRTFRGVAWAGLRAGHARLADDRPARIFTTAPLSQSAIVLTPGHAYVVSPRDPDAFVEAWRARHSLGPTQRWREEEQRAWFLDLAIWRDQLAWALVALGLLANLALFGYLGAIFDQLPAMLSFHFNLLGQPDRIAGRSEILRLPQVGLLMLILDLALGFILYRQQRIVAYLIWGGGLVLQLLIWGAVLTIIG